MAGRPSKYPPELRERAVRMVAQVAVKLGIGSAQTLRGWLRKAEAVAARAPDAPDPQAELARLRRENAELQRANEVFKAASSFFAAELDRPHRRSCVPAGGCCAMRDERLEVRRLPCRPRPIGGPRPVFPAERVSQPQGPGRSCEANAGPPGTFIVRAIVASAGSCFPGMAGVWLHGSERLAEDWPFVKTP
jgi:transposase